MLIDKTLMDKVSDGARKNSRLRMNFNFHASADSPAQRLLNALEPGTDVPVHHHAGTSETFIVLRGSVRVTYFDDSGEITDTFLLDAKTDNIGMDISVNQWHKLESLETGTIIFEVKDGPYHPLDKRNILQKSGSTY